VLYDLLSARLMAYAVQNDISVVEVRISNTGRFLIKDRSDDGLNVSRR
jgi:hypothetical protein